jgi:hypothetical protein
MKKILVVLLVLAVATGVFAQEGEWSFNGKAEMGVIIDFDPAPDSDESILASSGPTQYNRSYDGYDGIKGQFGINYNYGVFGAGLTIQSITHNAGPTFIGTLNADGENYQFGVESNLTGLFGIVGGFPGFRQLWGNYSFMNGVIFLETAYSRPGQDFWKSDTTGAFRNYNGEGNNVINGPFVGDNTFTHTDTAGDASGVPASGDTTASYIVGDVRLQGLSFGLMMRDVFVPGFIVDDVLKKMIFGLKFEMSPFEIAAQFLMENYGVYVGGKWMAGPVTVGLSFMGLLNEKERDLTKDKVWTRTGSTPPDGTYMTEIGYKAANTTKMKVGGGVNYDADAFGAAIKAFYSIDGDDDGLTGRTDDFNNTFVGNRITEIGVEPEFYYNVIPSHLQFKLNTGFYFFGYKDRTDEKVTDKVNTVQYALQPQLFWNFLGTGAGGYGGTGIALRYRLVGGDAKKYAPIGLNNKFDVNFSYSF